LSWIYAEKPLIPRGPDGSFDKNLIHNASTVSPGNDPALDYYTGWPNGHMRHPYLPAIGLATWPLDRFVSLEPVEGRRTRLGHHQTVPTRTATAWNSSGCPRAGWRLKFLDAEGAPQPGFTQKGFGRGPCRPWTASACKRVGTNQADLSKLQGQTVRLNSLSLHRARLFAFQVTRDNQD